MLSNKIHSLASSSSGNAYLYELNGQRILVDLGITNKRFIDKLNEINIDPQTIDVVFITHEHIDHIRGLKVFLKKHNPQVYMNAETFDSVDFPIDNFEPMEDFVDLNGIKVHRLNTSHDAANSMGLMFEMGEERLVHITDTGYLNPQIQEDIKDADYYVMESNYEYPELVKNKKYPFMTKQRIMSDLGHLSNDQCNEYLRNSIGDSTKLVCYAHLSENNNHPDFVSTMNENITNVEKQIFDKDETVTVILGE